MYVSNDDKIEMLWMFVRPMRHLVTHGGAELLRLLGGDLN